MRVCVWVDQSPVQGDIAISYIILQPEQYLDIAQKRGQYLYIAWESAFFDPHFGL